MLKKIAILGLLTISFAAQARVSITFKCQNLQKNNLQVTLWGDHVPTAILNGKQVKTYQMFGTRYQRDLGSEIHTIEGQTYIMGLNMQAPVRQWEMFQMTWEGAKRLNCQITETK